MNTWNREQLMLAINYYCKVPYGQFNVRGKDVNHLAKLINRTPGAVAFMLVNFVSVDPEQQKVGRKGATHIGKLAETVFREFMADFNNCFLESEKLLAEYEARYKTEDYTRNIDTEKTGKYTIRETKVRVNQDYFRTMVLSNYPFGCAITEISVPELLIASHIKPWAKDEENRLNPTNGICLSGTFDKAFDKGLITIDEDYRIVFSNELKSYSRQGFFKKEFEKYENCRIHLPIKFLPNKDFLQYHNDNIFLG